MEFCKMNKFEYGDIIMATFWPDINKTDIYIQEADGVNLFVVNRILDAWEVPYLVDLLNAGAKLVTEDFLAGRIMLVEPDCIENHKLCYSHAYVYGSETIELNQSGEKDANGLYCPMMTPYYRISSEHEIIDGTLNNEEIK
jgi:hypothetical protein